MKAIIGYALPDAAFWSEYEQLWSNSISCPVFQSPKFIRYLAGRFGDDLAIFQFRSGERLKGAAFFRKENGIYQFLSDLKSDHNFFVIDRDCTQDEVTGFFDLFFRHVRQECWRLRLQKKPVNVSYMDTLVEAASGSGLLLVQGKQAVCPVLRESSPEALSNNLCKSKKAMRNIKALTRQSEPLLEVFQDDEELDAWVDAFCALHVARWKNTPTPSRYETPGNQDMLVDCMRAWILDGVLIRFSLCLGTQRVAYCWGFIQEQTFIAHAQAYDAEYSRNSPIKVLIHFIGRWVRDQQINTMDFGYGSDEYKYAFANEELDLKSISVSGKRHLPFIIRDGINMRLRQNRTFYRFLRTSVKPAIQKIYVGNRAIVSENSTVKTDT